MRPPPGVDRTLGPRERLLAAGGAALGDAELVGLVLDGGTGTAAARGLAERLLDVAGGIARLERIDRRGCAAAGVRGTRRVAALRAALELGRRAAAMPFAAGSPVRDAGAVYEHFRGR